MPFLKNIIKCIIYFIFIVLLLFIFFQTTLVGNINSVISDIIPGGISSFKKTEYKPVYESVSNAKVYFCPFDNCEDVFINLFNSSLSNINCAFYDVKESIVNELSKKQNNIENNAYVKLVIDGQYSDKILNFKNSLTNIKKDYNIRKDNEGIMHNKFCIIDNKTIITGSTNPTENGFNKNDNNIVVIESEYLSENYMMEFYELWNGIFKAGKKVKYPVVYLNNKRYENYFCPEDDCEEHILETLRKAKKSIYFMAFSFTSDAIGDYLISRKDLTIKGVFEKSQNNKYNEYEKMKKSGVEAVFDQNKGNMHHKVFIIDESIVITGSYNPTQNGNKYNDENILIIHDAVIAEKFMEEFWRVYKN